MKPQVDKIVKTVTEVNCPSLLKAYFLPSQEDDFFAVESSWKYADLSSIKYVNNVTHQVCQRNGDDVKVISSTSHNVNSVSLCTVSKSGDIKVVLRKEKNGSNESCPFIEVYKNSRCIHCFDMSEVKLHGDIYCTGEFATFDISKDEKKLLYAAEKKVPKTESYFKKSEPPKDDAKAEDSPVKGEEFAYREDWGEKHVKMSHSVLCLLDLDTGNVTVLPEVQEANVTSGQGVWSESGIVFVGWYEDPYRLGSYCCQIRRNSLFYYELGSEKPVQLTSDTFSVFSPRFSPDGKFLIYLRNAASGPHKRGQQLVKMDFKNKDTKVIVDLVHECGKDVFPGIYNFGLPDGCFTGDGKYVLFDSNWRSKSVVLCVNLSTGSVQKLDIYDAIGSCTVLDVSDDLVAICASSPSIQPHLVVGKLNFNDDDVSVKWSNLTPVIKLEDIKWEICTLKPAVENESFPGLDYEVVVITPEKVQKSVPLLIFPHGGPHVTSDPLYSVEIATFIRMGFAVCRVNYRGSMGFGEKNLHSLLGNVGTQDVQDVHFSAEFVRNMLKSPEKGISAEVNDIFYLGGSHAGFLGAHLIGQYPGYYKACALLNPVTDLTCMIAPTDIPDWIWIESGIKETFDFGTPDEAMLSKMLKMSPIYYLDKVKTPTLLLVGSKDRRVPPSQSLNYYRNLKARKVPVKMYVYEDNHSLQATANFSSDVIMQILLFLTEHCTDQTIEKE